MCLPDARPSANFSVTEVVRLINRHGKAFAFHVQDEVFAHDGEADEADVAGAGRSCHNQ